MKTRALLLCLLVLAATACSPGNLLDYRVTGGIAGLDEHLVIRPNGDATVTRRGTQSQFTIDSATLQQIKDLLAQADFSHLQPKYEPPQPGADLITYTLTYSGHTVEAQTGAVPEALQQVLDLLDRIIASQPL